MIPGLDPGIGEVVRWLRGHGYETTDSGDGVSKFAGGDPPEDAMPVPNVAMVVAPEAMVGECDMLHMLLVTNGLTGEGVTIQGTYEPGGPAVILLLGLDDALLGVRP